MKNAGIRLSPKHGVNPSLGVCYICGEDDGTVVLPGRLPDDAEAPRRAVWSRAPCPTCRAYMQDGVVFLSVRDGEHGVNPFRTGQYAVVRDEAVQRLIREPLQTEVLKTRVCFVEDSTWAAIGLPTGKAG